SGFDDPRRKNGEELSAIGSQPSARRQCFRWRAGYFFLECLVLQSSYRVWNEGDFSFARLLSVSMNFISRSSILPSAKSVSRSQPASLASILPSLSTLSCTTLKKKFSKLSVN